eukprot:gene65747-89964_t
MDIPLLIGANSNEASVMSALGVPLTAADAFLGPDKAKAKAAYGDIAATERARQVLGDAWFVAPARWLAEALESGARQLLAQADLAGAATRLQEAADLWREINSDDRAASCLLLAASTWRLAGVLDASHAMVEQATALTMSPELARGFELERAEQALARGHPAQAHALMDAFLERHGGQLDPLLRAQVLQRRAAAATAAHHWPQAASDFSAAAEL